MVFILLNSDSNTLKDSFGSAIQYVYHCTCNSRGAKLGGERAVAPPRWPRGGGKALILAISYMRRSPINSSINFRGLNYVSIFENICLRFLWTARFFHESLWYLHTYLTYVQVIFRRSHPTLKLTKQKMSKILQVAMFQFFYFAEIQKMTKLGPKNRFWGLKIKINPSGIRLNLNHSKSFFEIQT